jgi:neutral trehalase
LNKQCEDDARAKTYLEAEIKRYQDSLSFQCRQLDEAVVKEADGKNKEIENDHLKNMVEAKEKEINEIYARHVNKPRNTQGSQTDHSSMAQFEQMA